LQAALENNIRESEREFMWSEGDGRAQGGFGGTRGEEDSVGVTGTLTLRNMQSVVLRRTPTLSSDARLAVGSVTGDGQELIVRKFVGGMLTGRATWSAWDNLAVNVDGGVQESVSAGGSPLLIVRTSWYWDQWGANSTTWMEIRVSVNDDGTLRMAAVYEGTPGD
jgi:hypothetical protein